MPDNPLATRSSELTFNSFRLSETGLDIIGEPTLEDWLHVGTFINRSQRAVHFWIGDWLNYGESTWGERYDEMAHQTGYDYQTLRNDKWVASRIPPERRLPELSFTHHKEVADLSPDEQDELLGIARDQQLNYEKFRKVVKLHGLTLTDQGLSPRGDKSDAQQLIAALVDLTHRLNDTDPTGFTMDERATLAERCGELQAAGKTFVLLLASYESTDVATP